MGLTCCQSTVVCLSVVDLILGAFFLFIGLWILLDWKIQSIMAWLPFVVIGGLLLFTTFLSFCGTCANKCCGCCLKISSPLVLFICLLECALGLAITLDWGMVDRYLDKEIHTIDPDSGNSTGSTADGELVAEDAEPHYSVGETISPHDASAVKGKVKEYHQIIAYVLFGLSCLQLVRLLAAWCVNKRKRSQYGKGNAQSWLYDDSTDKYKSLDESARVHENLAAKYADRAARDGEARGRLSERQESLLPGRAGSRTTTSAFQRNTDTQIIDLTPKKCAIM